MVSRRWDPGIIIGISICADSYHGDWKWGSLSRFLGFDLGINRGIFGGIRKVPIRLYWNSISNVINVESRIYEDSETQSKIGFSWIWKLRYLGISEWRRNLGIEIESINLLRYRFMWENFLDEKKEKWWQYKRMKLENRVRSRPWERRTRCYLLSSSRTEVRVDSLEKDKGLHMIEGVTEDQEALEEDVEM
ncbi:hypothetical protein HID58_048253, partial [Brassica napus]